MRQYKTRLSFLMDRLEVRPKDMAEATGIHKTLISKWRSGNRRLLFANPASIKIASYLMDMDVQKTAIQKILAAYNLTDVLATQEENLMLWLSEEPGTLPSVRELPDMQEYTSNFKVFLGISGLKKAIESYLDFILEMPPGQQLIAVIRDNYQWFAGDLELAKILLEKLESAFFQRGIRLKCLYRDDFHAEELSRFVGPWLLAHLRGYVKSAYLDRTSFPDDRKVLVAAEDYAALTLHSDPHVPDQIYTAFYTDIVTARQIHYQCKQYEPLASEHFVYHFFENPGSFFDGIKKETLSMQQSYLFSRLPFFSQMTIKKLEKDFSLSSKIDIQRTRAFAPLFLPPCEFDPETHIRHIFCLEQIQNTLQKNRCLALPPSSIYHKRFYVSNERSKDMLLKIQSWMKSNPNYEAVFVPESFFSRVGMEFFSIENKFSVAWLPSAENSCAVKDQTLSNAIFSYGDQLWDHIPPGCKDRKRNLRLLSNWNST